jgi:hypothetical protein
MYSLGCGLPRKNLLMTKLVISRKIIIITRKEDEAEEERMAEKKLKAEDERKCPQNMYVGFKKIWNVISIYTQILFKVLPKK